MAKDVLTVHLQDSFVWLAITNKEFLRAVRGVLRPGRQFMVAEPAHHVWPKQFERLLDSVQAAGFRECGRPRVRFSRAALFERAE